MKTRTTPWIGRTAILFATAAMLHGCGGGGGGDDGGVPAAPAPQAGSVPDSAGATAASFFAFIQALALGDETSEPLTFGSSFTPPPEDLDEPAPIG